jgi:chromosome segregation protein
MLGDFVETEPERAALVEAALGPAARALVVERRGDLPAAARQVAEVTGDGGGVELICLEATGAAAPAGAGPDRPTGDRIVGCPLDWVRGAEPAAEALLRRLLSRTVVAEDVERAFELAGRPGGPWRVVTRDGCVLETDGRLRVGVASEGGVIWRKSELAELARRVEAARANVEQTQADLDDLLARQKHAEQLRHQLRTAVYEATTKKVEHQGHIERVDGKVAELEREAPLVAEEARQLAEEIDAAGQREAQAREAAARLEDSKTAREGEVARLTAEHHRLVEEVEALAAEATAARVDEAQTRQRCESVEETIRRLESLAEALSGELTAAEQAAESAGRRRGEAEQSARAARQEAAEALRRRQALQTEAEENAETRRGLLERLEQVRAQLDQRQQQQDGCERKLSDLRVRLGEVEVRIEGLITRTQDELELDLAAEYEQYTHDDERDWEAVRAEIEDLRGKISRLGNVNLDAIAEQEELQNRHEHLSGQVEDIRASQRQLEDLIRRINNESRKRFEESFELVRSHFNELFRKLFGGGKADVLLTDPEDVLESGIEIVARPPGKELRSLSLLSGGEKTMTALALMFSFFRARPSPFCLLDEVDAALDETNTERFVHLVREFLDSSQFVIVSHAKRTIALADQIYGVTMQEPGVSRRISVRFEQAAEMADTEEQAAVA